MSLRVRMIAVAAFMVLGIVALLAPLTGAAPAGEKDYTADLRQLSKKLDEVLAAQKELANVLETRHATVMEELRIVKVRAHRAQ